jgi:crotonobetainyl-CoA:carnitine CoA-transferase CaiB-like acyl-CoA transferase
MTTTAARNETAPARGPLAGLRVLDLTWEIAGPYCTKLMADYGADVIKIERPGSGDRSRQLPPFFGNKPDPEASLHFLYLNTNKRGLTLNLKHESGRQIFLDLARRADVVVESFSPGVIDRLGIGWDVLNRINPRLILTSISNFGQTGPYRDLPATELTEYAMSGMMTISGSQDREPLKHGLSQGQYSAGTNAAYITATLTYTQAMGAPGQWIDVSILESLSSELVMNEPHYAWMGSIQGRRPPAGDVLNNIAATSDGYVVLQLGGSSKWSDIADMLEMPELNDPRFETAQARARNAEELDTLLAERLRQRGKHEWFDEAAKRRILFGIAQDPQDLLNCPQLNARGYWVPVEHPRTGTLRYPGEPVRMSSTPWQQRFPAPLLGQHTDQILGDELGFSAAEIAGLRAERVI